MAYTGKYIAYVQLSDGSRAEWKGLRKAQAQWRYHWIDRNQSKLYPRLKEFGWQREWESA